jgi:predicted 3-demethylubiquinone-9 3-methyltransferase (glyoxalase superfamily)
MQKITTFLTFNTQAEEAVKLYTSLFKNGKITQETRYGPNMPAPEGQVMTMAFELDGEQFVALNANTDFQFGLGVSLLVRCEDQAEIDRLWDGLIDGGGEAMQCGWLKDRFGVAWQITPKDFDKMLSSADAAGRDRFMAAMMQMTKMDIATLERAWKGE